VFLFTFQRPKTSLKFYKKFFQKLRD